MDKFLRLLDKVVKDSLYGVKGYFKSRMIIFVIVFIILFIGFSILEISYALMAALLLSVIDIIPLVGAGIIMIPWAIITYIGGNQNLGVGLAVLYVILTIGKQFIEPKIVGDQIGIRPLYTFAATILGTVFFGPLGLMLGPIIAVIIKSILTVRDLDRHNK